MNIMTMITNAEKFTLDLFFLTDGFACFVAFIHVNLLLEEHK